MKKILFRCLLLLVFTGCKKESQKKQNCDRVVSYADDRNGTRKTVTVNYTSELPQSVIETYESSGYKSVYRFQYSQNNRTVETFTSANSSPERRLDSIVLNTNGSVAFKKVFFLDGVVTSEYEYDQDGFQISYNHKTYNLAGVLQNSNRGTYTNTIVNGNLVKQVSSSGQVREYEYKLTEQWYSVYIGYTSAYHFGNISKNMLTKSKLNGMDDTFYTYSFDQKKRLKEMKLNGVIASDKYMRVYNYLCD